MHGPVQAKARDPAGIRCRSCSVAFTQYNPDVLCPDCAERDRCERLARRFAADNGETINDEYRVAAAQIVKRWSVRPTRIEPVRERAQRWCEGCQRTRFAGAWSFKGICRFCSTLSTIARESGAQFIQQRSGYLAWREQQRAQARFTRQQDARARRDALPQADGRSVVYLYQPRGWSRGSEQLPSLADRLPASQESEPETAILHEETAAIVRSIVGDLDETDILRLDEARLMVLRQRLTDAGLTPRGITVTERKLRQVQQQPEKRTRQKGRLRGDAARASLAED